MLLTHLLRLAVNLSTLLYSIFCTIMLTGTTQTAGAQDKGGNFIGQLCISVVPHWIICSHYQIVRDCVYLSYLNTHTSYIGQARLACNLVKLEGPEIDFDRPRASDPPILGPLMRYDWYKPGSKSSIRIHGYIPPLLVRKSDLHHSTDTIHLWVKSVPHSENVFTLAFIC